MKARIAISILMTALVAGLGGWFAARYVTATKPAEAPSARKVLFYQSPMHPWIKSDKPGNCTICGMKLVPVYEGEKGLEGRADIVSLPSNSITIVNVQTELVGRRPLTHTLRVAGRIDDDDTRHRFVSAYVDGRIEKLFVNYVGADVVEGQPLATFYSPQLLSAGREYLTLLRGESVHNPAFANSVELGTEQAKLRLGAAQRLKRLGLTDAQIKELSQKQDVGSQTEIHSPMSGTVVSRFVYEGQYVKEGEKLFELADFSTMWFVFDAYERDLSWIKPGEMVEVTTPAVPGKVFAAPIAFVDPNLSESTRSAKVRVEIVNPLVEENGRKRRLLYHRLYAEGHVKAEMPDALVVSRSAVIAPGAQAFAYVDLGGGNYQQRKLKLGRLGDESWEVTEGLHEGDRVVTAGNLLIDAQAQLNQSTRHGVEAIHDRQIEPQPVSDTPAASTQEIGTTPTPVTSVPTEKLTEAQRKAARSFLAVVDAMSAALAADRLEAFNQESVKLKSILPGLTETFAQTTTWKPLVERVNSTGRFANVADLKTARKAFFHFSMAAVEFAKHLRHDSPDFAGIKVFQCPMTDRAFPGAPKSGQWLQLRTDIQNPFFGSQMIDCGSEVK